MMGDRLFSALCAMIVGAESLASTQGNKIRLRKGGGESVVLVKLGTGGKENTLFCTCF